MRNIIFVIKSLQEDIALDKDLDYMINITCHINSHRNASPVNQRPFDSSRIYNLLGSQDLLSNSNLSYLG